jgi:hypothetical protein
VDFRGQGDERVSVTRGGARDFDASGNTKVTQLRFWLSALPAA